MASSPVMDTVEQPLKPNQQNQRMNTPKRTQGQAVAGDGSGCEPSFVVFPNAWAKHLSANECCNTANHMQPRWSQQNHGSPAGTASRRPRSNGPKWDKLQR